MSKKNITNEDVIQEVEVVEAEVSEKPSEPETEVTKEETKVPFSKKAFKVIAAAGAGLVGVTVVGVKLISSFGNKKWNDGYSEGYDEGWHDSKDSWSGPSEPEETSEDAQEYENPEEE